MERHKIVSMGARIESLFMKAMGAADRKLPVEASHRGGESPIDRYRAPLPERRQNFLAEHLIDQISTPRAEALQLAEAPSAAAGLVLGPGAGNLSLEKPLPLAALKHLSGRDGPDHARSPRFLCDRTKRRYS